QYMILANANNHPGLVKWSDNIRQLESLQQHDLLTEERANQLATTYRTLRNHVHRLALQEQKAFVPKQKFKAEKEFIRQCWTDLIV
ncbi:MAG: hypothetical protein ACPG47_10600, partial [Leucothrix sp.]